MGLDTVEMIMDIEDEFGISIDDRDASRLETVGQIFDHVLMLMGRDPARKTATCASARCFYDVRRALRADRDVRPLRVRPDTTLEELVPEARRSGVVKRLTRKLRLPETPTRFVAQTGTREPQAGLRVRDIVASYVQHVPLRFVHGGRVDDDAVWHALCQIVTKYAGGDPARITRETHIIKDLGLG